MKKFRVFILLFVIAHSDGSKQNSPSSNFPFNYPYGRLRATSTTLYPSRIEDIAGGHTNSDVSVLATKDSDGNLYVLFLYELNPLQGETEVPNNYIEFSGASQTPYAGILYFSSSASPFVAATLNINYKGSIWDLQGLSFEVYDTSSSQYLQIGNTFYAREDVWSFLSLNFPATIVVGNVINAGVIAIRITAKGISPILLDFVQLEFYQEAPSSWYHSPSTELTSGYSPSSHRICSVSERSFLYDHVHKNIFLELNKTQGYVFAPHSNVLAPPARQMPQWAYGACIADAGFAEDAEDEEMSNTLSPLIQNSVTIAEVDNVLSDWIADSVFNSALRTSNRWSTLTHNAGMATIWYYPALEIISHNISTSGSYSLSFPSELQIGLDGNPNKFYYPQVFWLAPGDESAWLSPNGPYAQKYTEKVKQIAKTGADGIWMDVPVYFDTLVKWSDHSSWGAEAFKTDTGLTIPSVKNWDDPVWRRWVSWRHDNILRFLLGIVKEVRVVNPDFQFIIETYVCDYHDATLAGYDGAYLRKQNGITVVWEVSATSDTHGMRYAYEDDWASLIAMYKYGRGAVDYSKPSWAFCYGIMSDDAISVMAEAVSAGNAPYEVKTPGKEEGVPGDARKTMFNFINLNRQYLYDTVSAARVAVFHSTPSRDYVDHGEGNGLFCSMGPPASLKSSPGAIEVEWYSDSGTPEFDSCYKKQWMGEYRGIVKALINSHVPFNILPSPDLSSADLSPYKAISDAHAVLILALIQAGSTVVFTGSNPGGLNEYGDVRISSVFKEVLAADSSVSYGHGKAFWYRNNVGWDYIKETSVFAQRLSIPSSPNYDKLINPIFSSLVPQITLVNAHRCIHMEANQRDDVILVLQFTNFIGICESDPETRTNFPIVETSFGVNVKLYTDRAVASLKIASPTSPVQSTLSFSRSGVGCNSAISFDISVFQYAMVVIEMGQ